MRRYVVVSLSLLFLVSLLSTFASAQQPIQPNWRVRMATDDGNGENGADVYQFGVASLSGDGYGMDSTASDSEDLHYNFMQPIQKGLTATFGDKGWMRDFKSPRSPMDPQYDVYGHRKVWFLRVAGLGSANTDTPIRLAIRHVATAAGLPPLTLPYVQDGVTRNVPVRYRMKMTDNKGVAGAPANGTTWEIPMPAVFTSTSFFTLTLPTINISVPMQEQAFLDEGYQMEFWQELVTGSSGAVPEPSSLAALACGVMGLGGIFVRRRK